MMSEGAAPTVYHEMVNLDPHHKSKNQQKKSNFHIIEMHHAN
jgi:hypothetical protein